MITARDIAAALRGLGAGAGDVLFVHSDVRACLRVAGDTRDQKLDTICSGLEATVARGTLLLPTFTYSFCHELAFDRRQSPSTVGLLSEVFRRRPGVRRTADPLFSCAVRGPLPAPWEERLMQPADTDAFGSESVFAYLLEADARLAFIGLDVFWATLVHHVEQRERVPYRYFKDFHGEIVDGDERRASTARYYVRRLDGDFENHFPPLAEALHAAGLVAETRLPRGPELRVVGARDFAAFATAKLRQDPEFLLERGHRERVA